MSICNGKLSQRCLLPEGLGDLAHVGIGLGMQLQKTMGTVISLYIRDTYI